METKNPAEAGSLEILNNYQGNPVDVTGVFFALICDCRPASISVTSNFALTQAIT
jgi:hypothetical protein